MHGKEKSITTLCPGGKERMCRVLEMVRHGRLDLVPLIPPRTDCRGLQFVWQPVGWSHQNGNPTMNQD